MEQPAGQPASANVSRVSCLERAKHERGEKARSRNCAWCLRAWSGPWRCGDEERTDTGRSPYRAHGIRGTTRRIAIPPGWRWRPEGRPRSGPRSVRRWCGAYVSMIREWARRNDKKVCRPASNAGCCRLRTRGMSRGCGQNRERRSSLGQRPQGLARIGQEATPGKRVQRRAGNNRRRANEMPVRPLV
jgi:hypothetical protein